jgi:MFS family permease
MNSSVEAPARTAAHRFRARLAEPFAARDFRLLWLGETVSILGSQFHMLALPWLVLKLTGSELALGTVLMAAAIPRTVLMLMGGAVTDAFSPRRVMLGSNLARGFLVAGLAMAVAAEFAQAWHLFIFALVFGCADAFFYPAYTAIVPQVLRPESLRAGNGLLHGSAQFAGLLGPVSAGLVVGAASVTVAFWVDAASFFVASAALALMNSGNLGRRHPQPWTASSLLRSTGEGLHYAWRDPVLRALLLVTSVVNLAFAGPFLVGATTLADRKFGGAVALGTMMSALGGGALGGSLLAGSLPKLRRRGWLLISVLLTLGSGLLTLAFAPGVRTAALVLALIGVAAGCANTVVITWLQTRTAPEMIGRVISVVMLTSVGLTPFSYLLSGILARHGLGLLFGASGLLVLALAALALIYRPAREYKTDETEP